MESDGQKSIYWQVKYPFPLSNRDVSFKTKAVFTVSKQEGKQMCLKEAIMENIQLVPVTQRLP